VTTAQLSIVEAHDQVWRVGFKPTNMPLPRFYYVPSRSQRGDVRVRRVGPDALQRRRLRDPLLTVVDLAHVAVIENADGFGGVGRHGEGVVGVVTARPPTALGVVGSVTAGSGQTTAPPGVDLS
jgi:hypothetical protein